jgi:hypothetical protein
MWNEVEMIDLRDFHLDDHLLFDWSADVQKLIPSACNESPNQSVGAAI